MRYYANTISNGRTKTRFLLTPAEIKHIGEGPIKVESDGDDRVYIHHAERSRLHLKKNGVIQASVPFALPITGLVSIPCHPTPEGFLVNMAELNPIPIKSPKAPRTNTRIKVDLTLAGFRAAIALVNECAAAHHATLRIEDGVLRASIEV